MFFESKRAKLRSSLLTKMVGIVFLAVLIPFVVSMIITYVINYNAVIREASGRNAALFSAGITRWKAYIDSMENMPLSLYSDADSRLFFSNPEQDALSTEYSIQERMSEWLNADASFRKIEMQTKSGYRMSQEKIGREQDDNWRHGTAVNMRNLNQMLIGYRDTNKNPVAFAIKKDYIDYPHTDKLFTMTLYCDLSVLESIADSVNESSDESTITGIYDVDSDTLLYSTATPSTAVFEKYGDGWMYGRMGDEKGFYFASRCCYRGYNIEIFKFVPSHIILKNVYTLMMRLALVQLVLLVFVLIFALWVYRMIVTPIQDIVANMSEVEKGIYSYTARSKGGDEIALLDKTYAEMVERINVLINQEYRSALELSKSRLKMLQAQINPHFLNNMLQNISTKALKSGSMEIYTMVTRLARIFQYNMDTSTDTATTAQELAHIENYLLLQQERFPDSLSFELKCDDDAKGITIPKMILQPLVENSITHGLRGKEDGGRITVDVHRDDTKLYIVVTDDGAGISPEKTDEIRNRYKEDYTINTTEGHGIGFLNVLYRLNLFTGGDFTWNIYSEPMVKTEITLCLGLNKVMISEYISSPSASIVLEE